MHRNADTPAHSYTVHYSYDRLRIGFQKMIKLVFETEKRASFNTIAFATLREHSNIPARAKAASFRLVVNPYGFDCVIFTPRHQGVYHKLTHIEI